MEGPAADVAGIVLAGGRSTRMGRDKAALEWHGTTLVHHACMVLRRAGLDPVVVVRAAGQLLPELPWGTEIVTDAREGQGPLQGLASGLAAVATRASAAFVCSTDLPFLQPAFVRRVLTPLADPSVDVVLPVTDGHHQPLAAAYRTSLAALVDEMVAAGLLKPALLFDRVHVLRLDDEALLADPELRAADPELASLINVNEPDDYRAARDLPPRRTTG